MLASTPLAHRVRGGRSPGSRAIRLAVAVCDGRGLAAAGAGHFATQRRILPRQPAPPQAAGHGPDWPARY